MAGPNNMPADENSLTKLNLRRKRARFRAWHRGTREMDLIFGRFADSHLEAMNQHELDEFDNLLEISDIRLTQWITGMIPVPAEHDTPLFRRIRGHCKSGRR